MPEVLIASDGEHNEAHISDNDEIVNESKTISEVSIPRVESLEVLEDIRNYNSQDTTPETIEEDGDLLKVDITKEEIFTTQKEISHDLSEVSEPTRQPEPKEIRDSTTPYSLFGWSPRLLLVIFVVLSSCCFNVIFLELLVRQDPGIGNLVTFCQFLVIAVEGFFFTTKCGTVGPKVPFRSWIVLVIMYFLVSVTNNYALSYNIPMPLHMIFRAGSLMANMVMGMVLLGKRYKTVKYVSVVMITIGIATCTVMSATSRVSLKSGKAVFTEEGESEKGVDEILEALEAEETARLRELMTGITLLVFGLFMSARMGIYQEVIYGQYGKYAKEALFYTHALPLPGFLLLAPDMLHHWQICLSSPLVIVPFLNIELPSMVLHLIGNVVPQYLCICAVFVLTAECPSLTATLVLTFRKFLSLLFSIWYFRNPFSSLHWLGTGLVFAGIVLFSDIPTLLKTKSNKKTKTD